MASQEPESQIVPPDYDSEEFIPSSPPFPTYMAPQNADSSHARPHTSDEIPESQHADFQPDSYASRVGETQFESVEIDKQAVEASHKTDNGHSRYHAGDRAPESQHADFQPDSYASHIRETQFQSIEMDTQAVENLNFPDIHQNSQLREVTTPTAPLSAMSQAIPLLSRPGPGHLDDIADGFTFTRFDKPEKGKFNRPPIPTKPQRVAEKPSVEDQLNGAIESQLPKVATAVPPDVPSRPALLLEPSLTSTIAGSHIKTRLDVDGNHAHNVPQQEALLMPVAVHEPQTSVSAASTGRSAQTSSNKSHKRIKKPFPEPFPDVAGHPSSRRPRGNGPTVNIPLTDSRLNYAKQIFEATSGGTHTNTSQTRNFGPSIDVGNSNHRHRNHPASVLESSMRDVERILGRPTESTTHEQQAFPTQSSRRASAPLYHTGSAGNKNEQMTSLQPAHVPESITSVFQPGNVVQQYSEQWPVIEATRSPSDKPDDASAQADAMEQHNPDKHDLQETTSKSLCNEIEPNVPEPTHLASSQAGDVSEAGHPRAISISSRVPSRAQSEVLERPQSRRSNCGKPITRPMPPQDLRPQGASETIPHRGSRSTKIKKSNSGSTNPIPSEASTKHAASGQHRQQSRPSPKFFEDYKNFLENGQKFLDTMKDYEQQSQLVEAQKAEIEKLRDTSDSSIKQIKALESEKADLTDKLKKFADISSKYKKHMNDVVKAQKYLKSQANEIQKNTKEAVESMKKEGETHTATHTATKAALQKIEIAITDAKSIRAPAEKFALASRQYQDLEAAKQKLQNENEKLQNDKKKLVEDNNKLQIDVGAVAKNSQLLEATLEKRLMELSREKYHVEQLEKSRDDPLGSHKVLVELLKKTPNEVADELSKEGGLLAKVFDLVNATQAKVDEAAILGSSFMNQEAQPPASLIKLIEDQFSRLETSVQASNNGAAAQQESRIKLLDDFKTIVNQLRLNKETELRLNNRIVELVQSNDRLTVEKNAREREIEGLANQIDELKRDLIDCRGQLSSKHDELATALAAPKEDPRLRVQIQDLETANGTVTGQLESSNQELAKVKEELSSIRDSARRKDQQMKDREQELNDAQSRIKTLQEEKTKMLANKQQEIENASQEERHRVAKAAETSKATLKMKLESEINHLERKIKEKDTELAQVRERLQTAQDGSDTYENNTNNLQRELVLYKEQFLQQIAQLKRLDGQNPGLEISDRLEDTLQSVRDECTELRSHLESIRTENSQNMEAALSGQQAIEENLRHIDGLENKNEKLKERNSELQKRVENLNEAYNQQKALHAESRGNQSSMDGVKSIAFATPQGMLLRNQQIQDTRPSSRHIGNLESGSNLNNDRFHDGHGVETPEDALRKASRSIGSSRSGSQAGKAAQTSSVKFANNFETPPIRRQELLKEGSTNVNSSHPDSSVASQTQRSGSGTRSLKVAARKHGTFGQSSGKGAVPHQLNRTTMFAQGVQATYTGDGSSRSTNAADLQGSSGITPFTAFPSSISTESPITDLSSMMEELGSVPDQEQLQDAYAKARGKKDDTTDAKVAGIKVLQTFALRTMNSLEEVDGGRDAIPKSQARRKSMSNEEEALRRRTLQPPKPAIKKSKADNVSTSEPKPIVVTESSNRSTRAGSKAASQIQDGHRGSYNRAVSGGRSQTPKAGRPHVANKSAQGISNDAEHSPNIPPAKRNGLKRAPPTTQIQGASKRVRTSRGISLTGCDVVPDSQEMQTV